MRGAQFETGADTVGPISLELAAGERMARLFSRPRDAAIVARLAAGIVKASKGSVTIEAYDPRVQPVHCKRIAALVTHDPVSLEGIGFEHYIRYRAALWNIDAAVALDEARALRPRLDDVHDAFALPLIGALIARPQLVVIDRPQHAYAQAVLDAVGSRALLTTHTHLAAARAYEATQDYVRV
jgi:ABC-type Na+ transport system ATPase subunit NatA